MRCNIERRWRKVGKKEGGKRGNNGFLSLLWLVRPI